MEAAGGEDEDEVLSEVDSDASLEMPSSDEEDEEEEAGLEEAYAAKLVAQRLKAEAEGVKSKKRKAEEELDEGESEDGEEDGPLDINDLVHESIVGKKTKEEKKGKKDKAVDPKKAEKAKKRAEETPDERDSRTIFIGNVPSDCSTSNVRSPIYSKQARDSMLTLSSVVVSKEGARSPCSPISRSSCRSPSQLPASQTRLYPFPIHRFRIKGVRSKGNCWWRRRREGFRRSWRTRKEACEGMEGKRRKRSTRSQGWFPRKGGGTQAQHEQVWSSHRCTETSSRFHSRRTQ